MKTTILATYEIAATNAPILKLDRDILWSIIKLNTDLFVNHRTLQSTRCYSQVCQSWRSFIIESPALWGKLIDLNELYRAGEKWRSEVLRRSGHSLLWVKWDSTEVSTPNCGLFREFFDVVLNHHWERIQKLSIDLSKERTYNWWHAFSRPAPHLKEFAANLSMSTSRRTKLSCSTLQLFSDNAPSLNAFDARLGFSFNAPWVSTLRTVCLGYPFTMPEILDAVRAMPRLETIKIMSFCKSATPKKPMNSSERLDIFLPSVKQLAIEPSLPEALRALPHFRLLQHCSFALRPIANVWHNNLGCNQDEWSVRLLPLSERVQNYLHSNQPQKLWVRASNKWFLFTDYDPGPPPFTGLLPPNPFLSILISSQRLTRATTRLLFGTLSCPSLDLGFVTHLHLILKSESPPETFRAFVLSLHSLDCLTTSETSLDYLLDATQGPKMFFPRLQIIKLEKPGRRMGKLAHGVYVHSFLRFRERAGYPIEVLDLTQYTSLYCFGSMKELLKDIAGLTVLGDA
ncbi:hypothetical protein GALMADRAFT_144084 [Galerina marginata CBS 339.88]|uniref:F-box domain-containing protein n=1 Tax=Galerina marginata (strain CBS 339.88) TaxID=685588 RepID=A0A067SLW9_GALM3|nr:hypothetical protein GALMADRAFT_144084 [Galerina marginata CBS 339.88]